MRSAIGLVLLVTAILMSGPAAAAGTGTLQPGVGQHCVGWAAEEGKDVVLPPTECFTTFSQAISHATGGAVTLARGAKSLRQSDLIGLQASTVVGVEYLGTNFGDRSKTYTVSNPRGCLDGATFSDSFFDESWLRNDISSAASYQGCRSSHYDLANFAGVIYTCNGSCGSLLSLNNRTESLRWYNSLASSPNG